MSGKPFTILFVCHANLCRSPMAERLAHQAFTHALGTDAARLAISSAGTHAEPDLPIHPLAGVVLREFGANAERFASRPTAVAMLADADLVLTADRGQRAWCATALPATLSRTFTLRQFGRLAAAVQPGELAGTEPDTRLAHLVARMPAARSRVHWATEAEDNLDDPVNQPIAAFRCCAGQISWALDVMVALVRTR